MRVNATIKIMVTMPPIAISANGVSMKARWVSEAGFSVTV